MSKTARSILLLVAGPATRILHRNHGNLCHGKDVRHSFWYSFIRPLARLVNWSIQGGVTLVYPKMGYNPLHWRKKRRDSQWTSAITGKTETSLVSQARRYLHSSQSQPISTTLSEDSHFTVLIGFHSHLQYFRECVESVFHASSRSPDIYVELIVVNDDPSVDSVILQEILECTNLPSLVRTNKANLGICRSINEAIPHVSSEWILHLDCDDTLDPSAFLVLQDTIRRFPGIRFISSRVIDVTESGDVLSYRLRDETPVDLIENNYASHLKAIRKDLHREVGLFNPCFEGCQDFEFALRTALFEPLLFIPEYLYSYRWHDFSQTVGNCDRQNMTIIMVRQTYLLTIEWILNGISGLTVTFSGPYADQWLSRIPQAKTKADNSIVVEATKDFSGNAMKLLMVKLATSLVFAKSKNQDGPLESITLS